MSNQEHLQESAATSFNQKVKQARVAHEAGNHKRAKMHLDVARESMLSVRSTDMGKIQSAYKDYTELRKLHESAIKEDLTNKTIRPTDKIKVARVIADMLGVDKVESMTPEAAINMGLRKIKNKRMTPELIGVLQKMLNLAQEVGVKVDMSLMPASMKEEIHESEKVDTDSNYNAAKGILRIKDFNKLNKVGHGIVSPVDDQQDRHMKVKYKTEDMASADYKVNPETGRKFRAHKIEFANSRSRGKPGEDNKDVQEQSVDYDTGARKEKMAKQTDKANLILRHSKEREALATQHDNQKKAMSEEDEYSDFEILDLSDDELDALVNQANFDDLIDVADDDEVVIVDPDTGEEIDDMPVNEEMLAEVLSRSERMKARIRFMRTSAKRQRKMQIAMKRRADPKTLIKRARRMAIKLLKQKIMKKPVGKLSVAEKERAERMISQRKALIGRLALRLVPKLRRMESDRLLGVKAISPGITV